MLNYVPGDVVDVLRPDRAQVQHPAWLVLRELPAGRVLCRSRRTGRGRPSEFPVELVRHASEPLSPPR